MSTTRRRQNSTVSTSSRPLPHHTRQKSRVPIEPKSAHVSDAFLQRFLGAGFSAADYLNATLPALQTSSSSSSAAAAAVVRGNNNEPFLTTTTTTSSSSSPVPLAELSAQAQAQLSQLNAHTTRLTNTLTQLTDEILRSGGRLAYEVELLRGETLGLSETLAESLRDEVARFVPPDGPPRERTAAAVPPPTTTEATPTTTTTTTTTTAAGTVVAVADPVFIGQLQTLTLVRSRLDTVVKTFGDAMEFVFPPSEVSVSSSFLSVSAPEPGSEDRSTEEKGQKVLRQLRDEISDLLRGNGGGGSDPVEGIERAARRIEELKDLTAVWAGTAEEKGRTKFIDGLAKMVEDRHRELMREMEQAGRRDGRMDGESPGHKRSANGSLDATTGESRGLSGYGIMSQLQRLRTGL